MDSIITYEKSGVNIANGNDFVKKIKPFAAATKKPWANASLGGFGAVFDPKKAGFIDPLILTSTDGVGTKLAIAIAMRRYDTIGIDLVAMCVNDLLVEGAKPLAFLDYYACGQLNIINAAQVVKGISAGCIQANCALIGGETAEMPEFYDAEKFDLAGFVVGAIEREIYEHRQKPMAGDMLIALPSSGLHSNGYSLARKIIATHNLSYQDPCPFDKNISLGDALLTPTLIYEQASLLGFNHGLIKAGSHITGGGLLENLPRVFGDDLCANIDKNSWQIPPIFTFLQNLGNVPLNDLYRTLNCGIGMVFIVAQENISPLQKLWRDIGQESWVIGQLSAKIGAESVLIA